MPKSTKAQNKKLVLLDAHAIIHRAYHALPDFATTSGEPTGALYGLSTMLIKLITDLKPDYLVACFDLPGPTHRHEAYAEYKAGRVKADENLKIQLEGARGLFTAFGIPIYDQPGFEADDILGTIVHEMKGKKGIDIVIASGDMDTLQLVDGKKVQVYTLRKGLNDTVLYDESRVVERYGFKPALLVDYKGLRGDPSDNIIGVKGVGEKTATSLIDTFGTVEQIYKALKKSEEAYKKAGITERIKNILLDNEEEALFSKTLATIRSDAPISFTLPPHWSEALVLENVLTLFTKLEFRTLGDRVTKLVGQEPPGSTRKTTEVSRARDLPDPPAVAVRDAFPLQNQGASTGPSDREKELCLMLWVIDSNLTTPDMEDVYRFTKTVTAEEAGKVLEQELDKRQVRSVYEDIERPLISVVEAMNEYGIKVDKKVLQGLAETYHKELSKLEKRIWKSAGEEFNINSPKVLSQILFEKMDLGGSRQKRTPTGAISTKESELVKLQDKHPIIKDILDYRELQKLLSTYIDAIPPLLDKGSRLHSTFVQSGAATGRMASLRPNLQNIPIRTELGRVIRDAFVAERGYKLLALDYSQVELRIAAILSKDKYLLEIFKNGEDVHAGVAARVFGVPQEEVDVGMRSKAKTINFGILYGMGVNALKANLGTDRKEAQEFYNQYFQTFTGLAEYLDKVKAEAARKGYTETMFGRRRYFSGFNSSLPYVRAQAERMAINAPMQGTQADMIKLAMTEIDNYLKEEGLSEEVHLVLQVHDELVYEVKAGLVDEVEIRLKKIMESVIPKGKTEGVPILVDVHTGDNWGELK